MHEMSLVESVLQAMEDAARPSSSTRCWGAAGDRRAQRGRARSHALCFDAVVRDSLAEGAQLEIIALPGSGWCMACAKPSPCAKCLANAPSAAAMQMQVTGGTEMRIKDLEVE